MNRQFFIRLFATLAVATSLGSTWAWAQDEAPDAFVKRISVDVLDTIKADKAMRNGDVGRLCD